MSITQELASQFKDSPAIVCCRTTKGTAIAPSDLEDPSIFPDMNVVENIVVTNTDKIISKDSIPQFLIKKLETPSLSRGIPTVLCDSLHDLEQENIKMALKNTHNNKAKAARLLGIPRATFYRRLEEYGLMSFMLRDVDAT